MANMTTFTVVKSQKGRDQVVCSGYVYRLDKMSDDQKSFWRCVKRGCKGRVICEKDFKNSNVIEEKGNHNHC